MKKFTIIISAFLSLTLMLVNNSIYAQLTVEGPDYRYVRAHSTGFGAGDAALELLRGNEFQGSDWRIINDGGVLRMATTTDNFLTDGNEHFSITQSGNINMSNELYVANNIGIGTNNPQERLHILGVATPQYLRIESFTPPGSQIPLPAGIQLKSHQIINRNIPIPVTWDISNYNSTLRFNNGKNRMTITGRTVSIGSANAENEGKLIVTGDENGITNNGFTSTMTVRSGSQYMYFDGNEIDGSHGIYLNHNLDENVILATGGGNVGIGTSSPGVYKLAVNGKVKAREVRVTNQNWADFVFADDYQLPMLEEVEAFIQSNKHLPCVPSEAEVLANGTDLGEMDAVLLQKIEELTLYMIQLNKRNLELEQRLLNAGL